MRGGPLSRRRGFTVVEALVSLLLTLLLGTLVLATLAAQRRLQLALEREAELLATVRIARHLVGSELRDQWPRGPLAVARDSLGVRSFRGHAVVCPSPTPGGGLVVRPEGIRAPEELRDSLLLLGSAGEPPGVRLLESREPATCPSAGGGGWERWGVSPAPSGPPVFVRWFRRGSYHLAGGVLRYRSGNGTRQPLTPETLDPRSGGFAPGGGGTTLTLAPLRGPSWVLHLGGGGG